MHAGPAAKICTTVISCSLARARPGSGAAVSDLRDRDFSFPCSRPARILAVCDSLFPCSRAAGRDSLFPCTGRSPVIPWSLARARCVIRWSLGSSPPMSFAGPLLEQPLSLAGPLLERLSSLLLVRRSSSRCHLLFPCSSAHSHSLFPCSSAPACSGTEISRFDAVAVWAGARGSGRGDSQAVVSLWSLARGRPGSGRGVLTDCDFSVGLRRGSRHVRGRPCREFITL